MLFRFDLMYTYPHITDSRTKADLSDPDALCTLKTKMQSQMTPLVGRIREAHEAKSRALRSLLRC